MRSFANKFTLTTWTVSMANNESDCVDSKIFEGFSEYFMHISLHRCESVFMSIMHDNFILQKFLFVLLFGRC